LVAAQSAIRLFTQKVFAISAAGNDNSRGGQMLTQPPLGQNRFLTTKFFNL
jgi:hypothetical protein